MRDKQTMLYFKRVAILEVNFTEIKAFVLFYITIFGNEMFSIEMDPCMLFVRVKIARYIRFLSAKKNGSWALK